MGLRLREPIYNKPLFTAGVFGVSMFIAYTILTPIFPTRKLLGFDIFRIHIPLIILLGFSLFVVFILRQVVYEQNYFLISVFFIYSAILVLSIQNNPVILTTVFNHILFVSFIFIISSVVRDKKHIDLIIYVLFTIVGVLLIIATWEFMTGSHLPISRLSTGKYSGSYASTVYLNRNNFSFFLSSMAPILIHSLIHDDHTRLVGIFLSFFVLAGVIVAIINGSRTATFSYLLSIGFVLLAFYLRKMRSANFSWPHVGLLVYISSAISYILLPLVLSNPFDADAEGSLFIRWKLMRSGSESILSSPLIPKGLGMFETVLPITNSELPATPHNWATQLGVETGIIGLLVFVVTMGLLTDRLFTLYFNNLSDWGLPVGTVLLIFPINGLGPSNVLAQANIFWIMIGLGVGICIVSVEKDLSTV